MKYLKPVNIKAIKIERDIDATTNDDVVALQATQRPFVPMGCSISFSPGWEVDAGGGTAGLCQPAERDIYDCYVTCYWPAQMADHVNYSPDWASNCAAATKDWRNIDLVFP